MQTPTTFTISRSASSAPAEFFLHEQCGHSYGRIGTVRACLQEHLAALLERVEALKLILKTSDPETAERLLLDNVTVTVNEVSLRPPTSRRVFERLMTQAFHEKGSSS